MSRDHIRVWRVVVRLHETCCGVVSKSELATTWAAEMGPRCQKWQPRRPKLSAYQALREASCARNESADDAPEKKK